MPELFKNITAWLSTSGKTVPLKQWDVGRELRRRVKIRFDEMGIQIPFPHRVLIWENKENPNVKSQSSNAE